MRENVEFRIPEKHAQRFLRAEEGRGLGQIYHSVRLLNLAVTDPRYKEIGDITRQMREQENASFFLGWQIHRRYTAKELAEAKLFHLDITAIFEPEGEECGTLYDESYSCPFCGANRKQVSDLRLDLRKVPKNKDIACTIADEWIVSQRLAELMIDAKISGFELRPVRHKARYQNDAVDFRRYPAGQELTRQAEAIGLVYGTWEYYVWLNRPDQEELSDRVFQEHAEAMHKVPQKPLPKWYQLVVVSNPVPMVALTQCGTEPFEENLEGQYRCPLGHVAGLNLLSEVWGQRDAWDGSDINITREMIGTRRGVLVPTSLLLISQRFYQLLRTENIKGYKVEVAHLE